MYLHKHAGGGARCVKEKDRKESQGGQVEHGALHQDPWAVDFGDVIAFKSLMSTSTGVRMDPDLQKKVISDPQCTSLLSLSGHIVGREWGCYVGSQDSVWTGVIYYVDILANSHTSGESLYLRLLGTCCQKGTQLNVLVVVGGGSGLSQKCVYFLNDLLVLGLAETATVLT